MKPRQRRPARAIDVDCLPLIVPRFDRALAPISPERVRRLRKHLVQALRALRTMKRPPTTAAPAEPTLAGFTVRVALTACALCRGWCCKGGGDHAYLDDRTIARLRQAEPSLGALAVLRLYLARVPADGYEGSCVFHGKQGCTLDRMQRSDVCNHYFCGGLGDYVTRADAEKPVVVMAGEGSQMLTSPVLVP